MRDAACGALQYVVGLVIMTAVECNALCITVTQRRSASGTCVTYSAAVR